MLHIQWNLVNKLKRNTCLIRNHFEIPRHYNTNTTSYCYSEIPFERFWRSPGVHINEQYIRKPPDYLKERKLHPVLYI